MSGPQRAAAFVVAVLVAIGIAVVAVTALGTPVGRGPDASPDPSVSDRPSATASTPPSAAPSASPMTEEELLAALDEIERQVEAVRGLPPAEIEPPDLISRAELVDELRVLFEEDYPEEDRERDNRVLRAFGLLGPDQDVAELQLELLGDQVLGFYDDTDKRMVVVSDAGLDVAAKITYAHEYTHALQDAAYGLATLDTEAVGEDDRSLARITLIEGDATVAMLAWAFANLTQQELQEYALNTEIPDTSGIPNWMVAQLAFPYETGLTWAGALAGNPIAPDFGPIDDAFADPPTSTEQVMDESLDAWFEREEPIELDAPDVVGVLGEGWSEVETTTVGQATIEIMLAEFGAGALDADAAAEGWGGDRATVAYGPDGAFAVGWRLAWDSPADAEEFAAAYRDAASDLPLSIHVGEPDGAEVLVVHASDEEILRMVLVGIE